MDLQISDRSLCVLEIPSCPQGPKFAQNERYPVTDFVLLEKKQEIWANAHGTRESL